MLHEQFLPVVNFTISAISTFVVFLFLDHTIVRPFQAILNEKLAKDAEIAQRRYNEIISIDDINATHDDATDSYQVYLEESVEDAAQIIFEAYFKVNNASNHLLESEFMEDLDELVLVRLQKLCSNWDYRILNNIPCYN